MQLQAADYPAITRTVKPPQLCLTAACRVARVSDANSAPVRVLYDFYRKYMEYIAVMPHSQAFEDSLKRACLTPKAMEQARKMSQESGADALICAQDASMDGIESIRVVHIRGNNYAVIYQDKYAKRVIQIPLTVEQVDGHYMISNVGKATRTAYFKETNTHLQ